MKHLIFYYIALTIIVLHIPYTAHSQQEPVYDFIDLLSKEILANHHELPNRNDSRTHSQSRNYQEQELYNPSPKEAYRLGRDAANRGDFKTAYTLWEPLAQRGHIDAIFGLGRMFARGDGVPKDFEGAFKLFKYAAERGHVHAQFNLGHMYSQGEGVSKDPEQARVWYQKAASGGDPRAQQIVLAKKTSTDTFQPQESTTIIDEAIVSGKKEILLNQTSQADSSSAMVKTSNSQTEDSTGNIQDKTLPVKTETSKSYPKKMAIVNPQEKSSKTAYRSFEPKVSNSYYPPTNPTFRKQTTLSSKANSTYTGYHTGTYQSEPPAKESTLPQWMGGIFITLVMAFLTCLILAGRNSIIVYYDVKDLFISIVCLPFFLYGFLGFFSILIATLNFSFNELLSADAIQTLFHISICAAIITFHFQQCVRHNVSWKLALFIWPCKIIFAPIGVMFALGQLGRLFGKHSRIGDQLGAAICLSILCWMADQMINGERVESERRSKTKHGSPCSRGCYSNFFYNTLGMFGCVAAADGTISRNEEKFVCQFLETEFDLSSEAIEACLRQFRQLPNDNVCMITCARALYNDYRTSPELFELTIEALFKLATADQEPLTKDELGLLQSAACELRISRQKFSQLYGLYHGNRMTNDPARMRRLYNVLGCDESATNEEIKRAYRKLVQDFHPDKIQSKGLAPEFTKFATEKFRQINESYEEIREIRNF